MKQHKRLIAFLLAIVLTLSTVVSALAVTITVKYKYYVYSSQITFLKYDYSESTTPKLTNLTILAESSLGSGSALYHVKWIEPNQTICYCIQPGYHSDDSSNYAQGTSGAWYNLPAAKQSAVALAMAYGYPSADYGVASGDRNDSNTVMAEKFAATQAIIWGIICEYISPYNYYEWGSNPFYTCVDTSNYPTFALWYGEILEAMQNSVDIPSFSATTKKWCEPIVLQYDAASGKYTASVSDSNYVLSDFDFSYNSNGISVSQSGNKLNITATEAAAKTLMDTPVYLSSYGSAITVDPNKAVIGYYDKTGKYQAVAQYTGVGIDPQIAYIELTAKVAAGGLEITKVDGDTKTPLQGVGYRLYDAAAEQVAEGYTDRDGKLIFSNLPLGKYTYQEFYALDGYAQDCTVYEADLSEAKVLQVTHENKLKRGSLTVYKVDAAGMPLSGVRILLEKSTDAGVSWSPLEEKATGVDGIAAWAELTVGTDVHYRLTEIATLPGYSLMSSPLYEGSLPEGDTFDVAVTACNSQLTALPFTGSNGFTIYFMFAMLVLCAGFCFAKNYKVKKEYKRK